jgi:tetratricopeptide (TPR) repeat protein
LNERKLEHGPVPRGQRELSVSYAKVADVLQAQGNLAEALKSYRDSLATGDRLAKADPTNTDWQSYLFVSYQRVGEVLQAQGNLAEALNPITTVLPLPTAWPRPTPPIPVGKDGRPLRRTRRYASGVRQSRRSAEILSGRLAIADRLAKADAMPTGNAVSSPTTTGWATCFGHKETPRGP